MRHLTLLYMGRCDEAVLNRELESKGGFISPTEHSMRDRSIMDSAHTMVGAGCTCGRDDDKFFRSNKWVTSVGINSMTKEDLSIETIEKVDKIVTSHLKNRNRGTSK
jgi:hypothetical protein